MNQENIFKLLLIILLIGNNHGNQCHDDCRCGSFFGSVNDVVLMALLLGVITDNSALASEQTDTATTF